MGEHRGYSCDGGCGASTVLDKATDSVTRNGWFITYAPPGYPTLFTCSTECLVRAAEAIGGRGLRSLPNV